MVKEYCTLLVLVVTTTSDDLFSAKWLHDSQIQYVWCPSWHSCDIFSSKFAEGKSSLNTALQHPNNICNFCFCTTVHIFVIPSVVPMSHHQNYGRPTANITHSTFRISAPTPTSTTPFSDIFHVKAKNSPRAAFQDSNSPWWVKLYSLQRVYLSTRPEVKNS